MMRAGPILETVLYADDLAAIRRFYEGILGLSVYDEAEGRFVFFRQETQMLLFFNPQATEHQADRGGLPSHGAKGAGHLCFNATAPEIAAWKAHFEQHGVAIERLMTWPDGGTSLYFRDPAGNSLEFAEPRIWELPQALSLRNQKVVIATHNKGKLEEFAELLKPYGVSAVSAGDLGLGEPAETESTFIGNARIKAKSAVEASGLVAIADDSGLCVEALDGAPGVYTADWAGPSRDWNQAMRLVEEKLEARGAIAPPQRRATFMCTLCVMWLDGMERIYEGRAPGTLVWPPRGKLGHGYDPMFVPEGQSLTFAEMEPQAKNAISHRARALEALVRDLF